MLLLLKQRAESNTQQGAAPVGAALLQSDRDTKPVFNTELLALTTGTHLHLRFKIVLCNPAFALPASLKPNPKKI